MRCEDQTTQGGRSPTFTTEMRHYVFPPPNFESQSSSLEFLLKNQGDTSLRITNVTYFERDDNAEVSLLDEEDWRSGQIEIPSQSSRRVKFSWNVYDLIPDFVTVDFQTNIGAQRVTLETPEIDAQIRVTTPPALAELISGAEIEFSEVTVRGSDRVQVIIQSIGLVSLSVSSVCFLNDIGECINERRSGSFHLCQGNASTLRDCESPAAIGTLLSGATKTLSLFYAPETPRVDPERARLLISNNSIDSPEYVLSLTGLPCVRSASSPICGGCGDGLVSGVEECDDGDLLNDNECLNGCVKAVCGDGIVQSGVEGCDDGNEDDEDACTNHCEIAMCGDGIHRRDLIPGEEGYEACDDGNENQEDECTDTCTPPLAFPGCADTCSKWNQTLAQVEATLTWSGSLDMCDPGQLDESTLLSVEMLLNLYRELIYEEPVTFSQTEVSALQECALMMEANAQLSAQPPVEWSCYTEIGAAIADQALLADVNALDAVLTHLIDTANPITLKHRLRLLDPRLASIEVGSTDRYSCLSTTETNRDLRFTDWSAYPRACFPISALSDRQGHSLDDVGWTVILPPDTAINGDADVNVTRHTIESLSEPEGPEREPLEVEVSYIASEDRSAALLLKPQGWRTEEGYIYEVNIQQMSLNTQSSIRYNLIPINCSGVSVSP